LGPAFFCAEVFRPEVFLSKSSRQVFFRAHPFHRQAVLLRGLTLSSPATIIRE
jgi:hypothetical protein